MAVTVDTTGWTPIGSTSKTDNYVITPNIMVMVPHDGMSDTEATAREQVGFQDAHWAKVGHPGAVVVIMDRILDQDAGARDVYAEKGHGAMTLGFALIGGTFWGRAIAAIYTGLKKPPIETRFFATIEAAMPWLEELTRDVGRGG